MKKIMNQKAAEAAYVLAHAHALGLIRTITELLNHLPAPGDDERPINWAVAGTSQGIAERLEEAAEFLISALRD